MNAQQSLKLRELRAALEAAGLISLSAQAAALGLSRSTTWWLLSAKHKCHGVSATTIARILGAAKLPPAARAVLLEYASEKAAGLYGHNDNQRRRFTTRLSPSSCDIGEGARS
jgi:hypothetical protein